MSTLADETAGDMPVKDISFSHTAVGGLQESLAVPNGRPRQAAVPAGISRISREELEDRYLRLHEESLLLKQHIHKQEDKIRRMATKLVRLVKDRKRDGQAVQGPRPVARDVETEEMVEELQEKVRELTRQNEGLKQRLITAKQQQQQQQGPGRRHVPYGHVQPRINTGLRPPSRGHRTVDMNAKATQNLLPRYGHSLLDDARAEIRNLESEMESQKAHTEEMDHCTEMLREQLRRKERESEEQLQLLRELQANEQRSAVKDNVEMIKLQKQLADKGNAFTVLEGRFLQLQENQRILNGSHDAMMAQVEELSSQLKEEQLRSRGLENQLHASTLAQHRTEELQERILDLEKERDLLKENCDKLFSSAFDVTQEQKWKTREQQLKLQIVQLEVALKADLADKNEILDKIKLEREQNERLSQENQELQLRFLEQKQQVDEMKDRVKFFSKESDTDIAELSEALLLIKARKSQRNGELSFLQQVDEDVQRDLGRSLAELQAAHAETVQELEKTRSMLILQHKINRDYQTEVEIVTRKMEDIKMEHELKLDRLAQLLNMRAARVRKLEAQLKDIAYGTKAHTFRAEIAGQDAEAELEETLHLERGENLLEIHISRVQLSVGALEALADPDPSTFCTYAFYDFELQATAVAQGPQPAFNFTSRYTVCMDDAFLRYLQTGAVTLELQLASGTDFSTVAACQLRLHQILEREGRVFGTAPLTGVGGEVQSFGTLEYWLQLRLPMEQAARLYQERLKALGYLTSGHRGEQQSQQALAKGKVPSMAPEDSNPNDLRITVHRCSNLKARQPTTQPSPYVVYKLFDFPDHDTHILPASSHPQFDDHMIFPLPMDGGLDRYLRTEDLQVYVLDDLEPESHLYLGKAKVPLISLAHNKSITGTFELTAPSGQPSGTIDVTLEWRRPYCPPPGVSVPAFFAKETPEKLVAVQERSGAPRPPTPSGPEAVAPQPRQRTLLKEKLSGKKVSFMDDTPAESIVPEQSPPASAEGTSAHETLGVNPLHKFLLLVDLEDTEPHRGAEEEDDEEESHVSEGQLATASSTSTSQEADISEELPALDQAGEDALATDLNESMQSDSDDGIVAGQTVQGRPQPSERIRIEITSLRLARGSRVASDDTVSRLFIEYRFLDGPSVETPLSLPKPRAGQSIYYNYSSVIHVDAQNNKARRDLLRSAIRGDARQLESIKFIVVSDPPEEQQDQECEDVGMAFVRIASILEQQRDLVDATLDVVDMHDSTVTVGSLTVTVEALQALRSIQRELLPSHPSRETPYK
ncbi:protein fantom isoform X2 [Paramormyrops kingsleyae]|uniref:protein fantom isoform X2 n=1 Tax=Paramormyrops kingsleyae TaxID=1676925 RepID=UPI003B9755BB